MVLCGGVFFVGEVYYLADPCCIRFSGGSVPTSMEAWLRAADGGLAPCRGNGVMGPQYLQYLSYLSCTDNVSCNPWSGHPDVTKTTSNRTTPPPLKIARMDLKVGPWPARVESVAWLSHALVLWILIQPTITAGAGTGVEVGTLMALLVFFKLCWWSFRQVKPWVRVGFRIVGCICCIFQSWLHFTLHHGVFINTIHTQTEDIATHWRLLRQQRLLDRSFVCR
jgi:hypothetical protein